MKGKGKKKGKKPRIARESRGASHPYEEGTTNPHLKLAILEVVENQLRENNPPETRQTFERLLATGYPTGCATRSTRCIVEFEELTQKRDVLDHCRDDPR